jgi:ABC-type Fe3+-hydroxamate transport system substrate-binding protein
MLKFAIPAVAALALAACADSTPDDAETAVTAEGDTSVVVPAPTATETTVVTTPADGTVTTDTSDRVSVGPDGVSADVGDSDTRVKVDTKNGTMTVED